MPSEPSCMLISLDSPKWDGRTIYRAFIANLAPGCCLYNMLYDYQILPLCVGPEVWSTACNCLLKDDDLVIVITAFSVASYLSGCCGDDRFYKISRLSLAVLSLQESFLVSLQRLSSFEGVIVETVKFVKENGQAFLEVVEL